MIAAGEVTALDTVLEIGPGEGVLTRALLAAGARVICVEFDRELIPILTETFSSEISSGQLKLIEADILKWHLAENGLKKGEYKLIANIPYYITGAILEKFLSADNHPKTIVILIQKEVATRIVARDGKESILSLSVKAFGTPSIAAKVPASAFRPAPKVDSAILVIKNISTGNFEGKEKQRKIQEFFDAVHAGFAHKRKFAARNLEKTAKKELIGETFAQLGISLQARAEDIELSQWIALAKAFADKS